VVDLTKVIQAVAILEVEVAAKASGNFFPKSLLRNRK